MDERTLVADLTRAVLAAAAPEELDLFTANQDRYLDGLRDDESSKSNENLGFGLAPIAPLIPYNSLTAGEERNLDGLRDDESSKSDENLEFGLDPTVPLTPYAVVASTVAVRFVVEVLAQLATVETNAMRATVPIRVALPRPDPRRSHASR